MKDDLLTRMEAEISKKRATIAELESAIAELEGATNVVRRFTGISSNGVVSTSASGSSFAGLTIQACAMKLLAERSPQGYKELAAEAIRRGYKSPKGGNEDAVVQSFWAILNRKKDVFSAAGHGQYQIKANKTAETG